MYSSSDPQFAFHERTKFCLELNNEAVKVSPTWKIENKRLEERRTTRRNKGKSFLTILYPLFLGFSNFPSVRFSFFDFPLSLLGF